MSLIDNLLLFASLLTVSVLIFKGVIRYIDKHPAKKPEHEHKHKHI
jgi:hypothetical protein